jgi:hypothetical protein
MGRDRAMRTKHASDEAFDTWVTSGNGEHILRTHTVQAAFRQGWNASHARAEAAEAALQDLIAAFVRHRTTTHTLQTTPGDRKCLMCEQSDVAVAKAQATASSSAAADGES